MSNKILVVDDDIMFCKEMCRYFMGKGYSVLEAHDGDQALAAYMQERPDVVLLDVMMPGMSGFETLKELKAFDLEASVIMVTAIREKELAKQTLAEGASEYITKPINPDYLLNMVLLTQRDMTTVNLYTTPMDIQGARAKAWFSSHKIPFSDHNVVADQAALKLMVKISGSRNVPVIEIGDLVLVGFDENELVCSLGRELKLPREPS
jgi:DNA-binding response OmpR family regulator